MTHPSRAPGPPYLSAAAVLAVAAGLLGVSTPGASTSAAPAAGPSAPVPRDSSTRYVGEHGLWVTLPGDSVVVHWLTAGRTPGRLEALAGTDSLRPVHQASTPRSRGHRVAFPRPDAPRLLIRYGAVGEGSASAPGVFETEIRLDRRDPAPDAVEGVDSLFVIGDVHGEYGRLRRLLGNAGLVDSAGRWAGGRNHVVFMGDLVDRGSDVRRTLWFVYGLQIQAERAGGAVHTLLGNHEIMVLTGSHRYVQPKERLLARLYGAGYAEMFHPDRSVLGRWIAGWPVVLRVDRALFAHGGIGPRYADRSLEALNDSSRAWTGEALFRYFSDTTVAVSPMDSAALARRIRFFFQGPSPLWYRGFARSDTLSRQLARALSRHDVAVHVIAHTPVPEIRQSYGDSVVLVDLRRPASELLLLVREDDGYERWAIPLEGEPRRISPAGSTR